MSIPAIMHQRNEEYITCPHCANDDRTMMTLLGYLFTPKGRMMLCEVCARAFKVLDQ